MINIFKRFKLALKQRLSRNNWMLWVLSLYRLTYQITYILKLTAKMESKHDNWSINNHVIGKTYGWVVVVRCRFIIRRVWPGTAHGRVQRNSLQLCKRARASSPTRTHFCLLTLTHLRQSYLLTTYWRKW